MIIKKLDLTAFGKFKNKTLELKEGLNLICGRNEAGKTTIHKFIEGMFFGFFKPYSKNKIYTTNLDKYRPWDGKGYCGAIIYESEGREYRLERGFEKGNEYVRLYDNKTGDDITSTLDFDPAFKLPKANKHLGINSVLFRNTVSIGQLSNVTDDDLYKEIGDLMLNTQGTMSGDISYKAVISELEKKKSEIGTHKQTKSPLGKSTVRIEELKREREHCILTNEENKEKYNDIKKLNVLLVKLNEKKKQLNAAGQRRALAKSLRKYNEYIHIQNEIAQLEEKLKEKTTITDEDYDLYTQKNAQYQMLAKSIKELDEKKQASEQKHIEAKVELEQYLISTPKEKMEQMKSDSIVLNQSLEKIAKRKKDVKEEPQSDINIRYKSLGKKEKIFSVAGTILIILAIVSGIVGYLNGPVYYYAAAVLAALGLAGLILWRITGGKRAKIEPEYEKYESTLSRTYNTIIMYEIDIEQLKKKYKCQNTDELKATLAEAENYYDNIKGYEKRINDIEAVLRDIENERMLMNAKEHALKDDLANILISAGVTNTEQMKEAMNAARKKEVVKAQLEAKIKAAEELLEDKSIEELQSEANKAKMMNISQEEAASQAISIDTETINNEIMRVTSSIASIKGSVSESEALIRSLSEIDEELAKEKNKIREYEEDLAALELALSTIKNISNDIHSDLSNDFNGRISQIISGITQGRYDEVKVNSKMEITVVDSSSGRLAPISSLSGGTIDQLYFAMRFAIIDLMLTNKNIPVFLDDCFLQYDEQRLENILDFIAETSKHRQIVMFSCRSAEKNALAIKNYSYNYLELS